jgi:hypothetical protein
MSDFVDQQRRNTISLLAAALAGLVLPFRAWAAANSQELLPVLIYIGKLLTGSDRLDTEFAQEVLDLINIEPWGKEHLSQLAEKLAITADHPSVSLSDVSALLKPERYSDGERWFINHLLTTLLTGIYYHQSGNRVVSYQHALMFSVLVAPHGQCGGEFGFWSVVPVGEKHE